MFNNKNQFANKVDRKLTYSEVLVRINHNKMETNRCKIIGLNKHLLAKYCKIKESKSYNS